LNARYDNETNIQTQQPKLEDAPTVIAEAADMRPLTDLPITESVMTPADQLITVGLGESVDTARERAKEGSFDQLAVLDSRTQRIIGLIWLNAVRDVERDASLDPYVQNLSVAAPLDIAATLPEVIDRLVLQPAHLVGHGEAVVGLIHRSDLNKHAVRVALYTKITLLEMGLARIVEEHLHMDDWIGCLRETSQIKVLGRREVDRLKNNEISTIQYVDLSDLVDIVGKTNLWEKLSYPSKKRWEKEAKGLVELRHSIMHPVRSLVFDEESLADLRSREERLRNLIERLPLAGSQEASH